MGGIFFISLGITIQIVLLISIFDIYFTSPIVRGITPIENNIQALCKRVVVISVDGLRLDALLENDPYNNTPIAPYIRWSMDHRGSWGVSHCHLPTESRPGHVAMLAGFYEDPSAVTKGWKENPVDFDSIFNQTSCSFAWGSPDIVNIFFKGLKHNCSYKFTYDENQNFAGNTMELDNWVINEVSNFFKGSGNPLKYTKEKSLFFLHLLGQDTSGHTHKPHTEKYRQNLKNVDRIVKDIDVLFNQIFMDNSTAFVLTADHGMTDWGSHGAGDLSETDVPIVAWGKGIRKQKQLKQLEINQADVTPLLALLIGSSIPVNSIGSLPTSFLNFSSSNEAHAVFLNSRQILAQLQAKKSEIETNSPWVIYKKFEMKSLYSLVDKIKSDLNVGHFKEATENSLQLIKLSFDGINFYQNYFQRILFFLTTLSFVLWILILTITLNGANINPKFNIKNCTLLLILSVPCSFLIFKQNLPISYHAYAQLPIILFWLLAPFASALLLIFNKILKVENFIIILILFCGLELFVLGFFKRWSLSICLLGTTLISLWGENINIKNNLKLIIVWIISGVVLSIFTILPVIGKQPFPLFILISSLIISFVYFCFNLQMSWLNVYKTILVLTSGINSFWVQLTFLNNLELNYLNQYLSWFLLAHLPIFLIQPTVNVLEKLNSIFISLSIPFLLLTVNHESLFLITLFFNLTCWVYIEMKNSNSFRNFTVQYVRTSLHNTFSLSDLKLAYTLLTYIYVAFFGIGNLATLNSFDPAWVRCFLTTFSPYTMTSLILFKVVIPFFAVIAAFRVITIIIYVDPYKVFVCLLIYCNIMGINFLFLVRNNGSWLDIGTSLSHYVIQQVAIVFLLILYSFSQIIISNDLQITRNKSHYF